MSIENDDSCIWLMLWYLFYGILFAITILSLISIFINLGNFENYHVKSPVPICPCGGIYPKGMRIGLLPVTNIYNSY